MKILIIGGGGREHALGWKLKRSSQPVELFFAPGNPGTAQLGTNIPISVMDIPALLMFAMDNSIDLTVVGPEDPLIAGIVDTFRSNGLRIFGPTKAAAKLEGSKAYAKEIMGQGRVHTALFETFSNFEAAVKHVENLNRPCFVKASGPALGKGAIPCPTVEHARAALKSLMIDKKFADAGTTVVIEEWLEGDEISAHAICSYHHSIIFPLSRDHKRALDGDEGDNTGGMGAFVPVPGMSIMQKIIHSWVVERTLETLAVQEVPFSGLLFPGLKLVSEGAPRVLEFNVRFGDPETEAYMRLLESDLLEMLEGSVNDTLGKVEPVWNPGSAVSVILASGGYPGSYQKGFPITGLDEAEKLPGVVVFHCGTAMSADGKLVTNGGRVLAVTCCADTLERALEIVYQAVEKIHFEGMHYRRDIGKSGLVPAAAAR